MYVDISRTSLSGRGWRSRHLPAGSRGIVATGRQRRRHTCWVDVKRGVVERAGPCQGLNTTSMKIAPATKVGSDSPSRVTIEISEFLKMCPHRIRRSPAPLARAVRT
jgi:hypothetical protein